MLGQDFVLSAELAVVLFGTFVSWVQYCWRYIPRLKDAPVYQLAHERVKLLYLLHEMMSGMSVETSKGYSFSVYFGYMIDIHIPMLNAVEPVITLQDMVMRRLDPWNQADVPVFWTAATEYEDVLKDLWFARKSASVVCTRVLARGFFTMDNKRDTEKKMKDCCNADASTKEYRLARLILGLHYLGSYPGFPHESRAMRPVRLASIRMRMGFYRSSLTDIASEVAVSGTYEAIHRFVVFCTVAIPTLYTAVVSVKEMRDVLYYKGHNVMSMSGVMRQSIAQPDGNPSGKYLVDRLEVVRYNNKLDVMLQNDIKLHCVPKSKNGASSLGDMAYNDQHAYALDGKVGTASLPVRTCIVSYTFAPFLDARRHVCPCGSRKTKPLNELYTIALEAVHSGMVSRDVLLCMGLSYDVIMSLCSRTVNVKNDSLCNWTKLVLYVLHDVIKNHAFKRVHTLDSKLKRLQEVAYERHPDKSSSVVVCLYCGVLRNSYNKPTCKARKNNGVITDVKSITSGLSHGTDGASMRCRDCASPVHQLSLIGYIVYGRARVSEAVTSVMICCGCANMGSFESMTAVGTGLYCSACARK